MKGIVLAGGLGTRLLPLTMVTNKHLLPVYDKPMIYYPILSLVGAGITDIMIVTGGEFAGDFLKLLKNGEELGIGHLEYAYQEGHGGIADALMLAEDFANEEPICVMLGDNIINESIKEYIDEFVNNPIGAKILLKSVSDPHRFGVVTLDEKGNITTIIEKPNTTNSSLAVMGVYMYDTEVFKICQSLVPSQRNELEITDVNNHYLANNKLRYNIFNGQWSDAGTFETLYNAAMNVRYYGK